VSFGAEVYGVFAGKFLDYVTQGYWQESATK
jgi:hypothetical protein